MKRLLAFLIDRLDERSTWVGLVGILSALGIALTPDQIELIVVAGLALWGLVEAFLPDPNGKIIEQKSDNEVPPSDPNTP